MMYRIKGTFASKAQWELYNRTGIVPTKFKNYSKSQQKRITIQSEPKSKGTNYVCILLDGSTSMDHLANQVRNSFRTQIEEIKKVSNITGLNTILSMFSFSSDYMDTPNLKELIPFTNINSPIDIGRINYLPNGNTPLYWAIIETLKKFQCMGKDDNLLLYIITDGEENKSPYTHKEYDLRVTISSVNSKGCYTLAISCPKTLNTQQFINLGFSPGNIFKWEQTSAGYDSVVTANSIGTCSVMDNYSKGVRSTANVYDINMAAVTPQTISNLPVVNYRFTSWNVEKECDIKEFVESHNKTYLLGSAYYQLTKKELIQSHKDILVFDKISKSLYGGTSARSALNIPIGENIKVSPLNFMTYELFVQSTSVNRKLVRGTRLYYKK